MRRENRAYYMNLFRSAQAWSKGAAASPDLRVYLAEMGIERRYQFAAAKDETEEAFDRMFWLGEFYTWLKRDLAHDENLTAAERRELETEIARQCERATPRRNPDGLPSKAIRMFRKFHTRDWRGEGDFHGDLKIPHEIYLVGNAVHTLYASDKLNPTDGKDEGWIEYIHEHEHAVKVYSTDARAGGDGMLTKVPAWLRNCDQFTWLGKSLGFAYRDGAGTKHDVDATEPLPELYTIPSGKALLIIQGKRRLLAMLWGGRLAVQRRGIVY